jgi:type II restriction enzyme
MYLKLDEQVYGNYKSSSQIARVLTEAWVKSNMYCPSCGNDSLKTFENNPPVADFLCSSCLSEYELKSKKDSFSLKIVNGAYISMIRRINAENNPHFFFMNYSFRNLEVLNFMVIPKHYFANDIIEKRKPLSDIAKRAGWVGCNILLQNIPSTGKIFLIKDGIVENKQSVLNNWSKTSFLSSQRKESRGWLIEMLKIIDRIPSKEFKLSEAYSFENYLKNKFPKNNFVKDKIRQQLQILRDKGILEFKGSGLHKKA